MIEVGQEAPDFELASSLPREDGKPGKKVKLGDYRGKNVVLAFYPLDFSTVCSGELACFRDDFPRFDDDTTQLLGISVDSHWAHSVFAKQLGLAFPLLADFEPKGATAKRYGLYEDSRGFTKRATVIVDRSGKVAFVKDHGTPNARDNEEILAVLSRLG
jgi:mycoredoxin-dependent peroxiredoxin